jgi:hypothetical protein
MGSFFGLVSFDPDPVAGSAGLQGATQALDPCSQRRNPLSGKATIEALVKRRLLDALQKVAKGGAAGGVEIG